MRKSTSSFSSGEVSDLADDRSAIDVVAKGLKTLTNAELGRYGHLDKRGGTDNLGTLKAGTDWRLVSFEFSSFTQFQLEFGSGYVRFWSNDAQVEVTPGGAWLTATAYALGDAVTQSGTTYYCMEAHTSGTFATDLAAEKWYALEGNILEVPSPYTGSQIHEFQHQSIQDFIYLAHPSHPRKVLKRYADDHWQMEDPGFLGPYAEVDDEIEFTASAATGNIDLTSDTDFFEADHVGAKFRLFYRQPAATETGSIEEVWNAAASAGLSSTNHTAGDTIYVTPSSDRIFYTCIADYAFSTDHTGSNDPADYPTFFEAGAAMIGPTYMAGRWDFTTEGTWRGEFQIKTSEDGVEYNTVATHFTDDNE